MNKFFNSTDLSVVPTLANYSLIISGNFTSESYNYDFDWTDYYNFPATSTKQLYWNSESGTAAYSNIASKQLAVSQGQFASNSTLGNKFSNTDNVFVFQAY